MDQDGFTQLEALAQHWFPGSDLSEETMARALWMEKECWQRMQKAVANGVARAFSGRRKR
ncbi:DUF6890 family protein [Bacterioplanoides sp.]|uniref:DUF6890 family protein n=1 Tax=Bacterioplanoides sp. TaxID=2066072 RepID=UPI003B5AF0A6